MRRNGIVVLLKDSIAIWIRNGASTHAAALAYHAIFSMAPLLIICIAVATQLFSQAAVEGKIVALLENTVGTEGAIVVRDIMINSYSLIRPSRVATTMVILFELYGATLLFLQLRYALNAMWGIAPKAETVNQSLFGIIKEYALAVTAILTIGLILIGSLLLHALWTAIPATDLHAWVPHWDDLMRRGRFVVLPVLLTVLFALIFKWFPTAYIRWRDVWLGAILTALMVWLGGYLVGVYLGLSTWVSIYGAGSSLIIVLLWIYFSAWIVLFGAAFTCVYAARYGAPIVPHANARFVSPSPCS